MPPTSPIPLLPTHDTYTELQAAFDHFNLVLFDSSAAPCLITLQRERRSTGYFSFERFVNSATGDLIDEIALNPSYWGACSIEETLSTLVHEMVHQWQYHHGKPGRRGYHNREWADKMESIGLMPSDTGRPGGKRTGEHMADYILEGGRFAQACSALLTKEYRLSWVDRYPCIAVKEGVPIYPAPTATPGGTDDLEAEPTSPPAAAAPPPGAQWVQYPGSAAPGRSNRVKYRCPACGAQAWGKPSLRLLCGEDDCQHAPLLAVEDGHAAPRHG